jgi:single-stranded-DNA-specific exonuclease
VVPAQNKVELTDSVRYREGLDEIRIFRAFCEWAMKCSPAAVRDRIIRPILPSAGN